MRFWDLRGRTCVINLLLSFFIWTAIICWLGRLAVWAFIFRYFWTGKRLKSAMLSLIVYWRRVDRRLVFCWGVCSILIFFIVTIPTIRTIWCTCTVWWFVCTIRIIICCTTILLYWFVLTFFNQILPLFFFIFIIQPSLIPIFIQLIPINTL